MTGPANLPGPRSSVSVVPAVDRIDNVVDDIGDFLRQRLKRGRVLRRHFTNQPHRIMVHSLLQHCRDQLNAGIPMFLSHGNVRRWIYPSPNRTHQSKVSKNAIRTSKYWLIATKLTTSALLDCSLTERLLVWRTFSSAMARSNISFQWRSVSSCVNGIWKKNAENNDDFFPFPPRGDRNAWLFLQGTRDCFFKEHVTVSSRGRQNSSTKSPKKKFLSQKFSIEKVGRWE